MFYSSFIVRATAGNFGGADRRRRLYNGIARPGKLACMFNVPIYRAQRR